MSGITLWFVMKAKPVTSKPRAKFPMRLKAGNVSVVIYTGASRGYPFFTLAWHEGPERKRKTFARLEDARTEAAGVLLRLERGKAGVDMPEEARDAYKLAVRDLEGSGVPLNAAILEFMAARKLLDGGSLIEAARFYADRRPTCVKAISAHDAVEEFLVAKKSDGAGSRHLADARSRLRKFSKAFRSELAAIRQGDLETWLRGVAANPRTRNNYRNMLVTFYRWARDRGYVPRERQTEADRLPVSNDRGGETEIFRVADIRRMLDAADDKLRPWLAVRAFAGVRDAELTRLTWENVRFEQGVIEIRAGQAKTAARRLIPISPNLARWLAPYRGSEGRIGYRNGARLAQRLAGELGIAWVRNGLRHGYGSHRLAATSDAAKVAHEMGNTERMVHQHYKELVTESEGKAWFDIVPDAPVNVVPMVKRRVA